MTLATLHLVLIGLWVGLVLAEAVMEFGAQGVEQERLTAKLHFWIDVLFELPVLAGIVATGAWMLAAQWPPTPLLALKVVAGLGAIGINALCAVQVIRRYQRADDAAELARLGWWVRSSWVGVPLWVVAAWIGVVYYG